MTLKLRILRSLTRLFIILVSLTRSIIGEKWLISNRCISGLMSNLIKKSWTVSNPGVDPYWAWFLWRLCWILSSPQRTFQRELDFEFCSHHFSTFWKGGRNQRICRRGLCRRPLFQYINDLDAGFFSRKKQKAAFIQVPKLSKYFGESYSI